ncbi:alpha/beta hydrolase-fold protein [Chishuiella sp.]|uniref:alpha/beta hydrolase n=1 Tax=Chishuiella sp. TaxID=1969467 RepID=UPI0028ABD62B|nr:alpha/beta hydrolase-fold protein [Chishuiella sp.]
MKVVISMFTWVMFSFIVSAQQIIHKNVFSKKMNKDVATVIITPNFEQGKTYNSVYILHGFSGNPDRTYKEDIPDLVQLAEKYQTIYIIPDGNFSSWYVDSPVDEKSQYGTFLGKELIQFIDVNYPTKKDQKYRGILGWSMGGYGALSIAISNQNVFSKVGSVSGAIDFNRFGEAYQLYKVDKVLGDLKNVPSEYFIYNKINEIIPSKQMYFISCGTEDKGVIEMNRDLHLKLTNKKIEHLYTESLGVHNAEYWSKALSDQLTLFNKYFNINH